MALMASTFIPWEFRDGWDDVKPIPQAEAANPLVPINYSQEYVSAMSAFRYIYAHQEISPRILELTRAIITLNPAHYTVWAYRSKTLLQLREKPEHGDQLLIDELEMLDGLVHDHLKNYQVWQHRRVIVVALNDPSRELDFTSRALELDAKNYHTWAYRQWALSHFYAEKAGHNIWRNEVAYTDQLLEEDVRNNSAWNHRWFIVFARATPAIVNEINNEISYVKERLLPIPNNPSAWNYLRGILDRFQKSYVDHLDWAQTLKSPVTSQADVPLALEFISDALAQQTTAAAQTQRQATLERLKTVDPIRRGYWEWKEGEVVGAS